MTVATPDGGQPRRRSGGGGNSRERLRLWLRLLRASRGMEAELRERLRVNYQLTLPQFDVLAALARREDGLTMTELSRYLMVSNGNVTGIIDRLAEIGFVDRLAAPGDRRAVVVRLTGRGVEAFARMAESHAGWVDDLLSELSRSEVGLMIGKLDRLVGRLRGEPQRRRDTRRERGRR